MPKVSFLSGEVGNTSLDLLPSHARIVRFLGPGCFLVTHSSICPFSSHQPPPLELWGKPRQQQPELAS